MLISWFHKKLNVFSLNAAPNNFPWGVTCGGSYTRNATACIIKAQNKISLGIYCWKTPNLNDESFKVPVLRSHKIKCTERVHSRIRPHRARTCARRTPQHARMHPMCNTVPTARPSRTTRAHAHRWASVLLHNIHKPNAVVAYGLTARAHTLPAHERVSLPMWTLRECFCRK
jgi:hypothetical protein